MTALPTDYFTHVGVPGTATTLSAPGHSVAGTTINVVSTSNWSTDTGVIFAMDTVTLVNGVETRVVGSYTEWEGVVTSATVIGSMVLRYGTDQNYPAGSTTRVYIPVSSSRENRLVDGLLVSHKQTGAMIDNLPLTSPKITTDISDTNGNELFKVTATASAVNELTVANAATGNGPTLSATGGDTNVDLNFAPKGTGKIKGVVNNLYNPYKFSAYRSANTTATASAWSKVALDAELFDTGSNFDSTTNFRFTAPIAGFYLITGAATVNVGASILTQAALYKNGLALIQGPVSVNTASGTSSVAAGVTGYIQLAASDYIELWTFNTQGSAPTLVGAAVNTYLHGALVSAG